MNKLVAFLATAFLATLAHSGEYPDISIADLKSAIAAKKVILIDANGSESWQQGHIPGAIDFDKQANRLASLLPKDKSSLVVAYCGGPQCIAYKAAAQATEKLGYTNVKHLSAGISGWKNAGEKIEKSEKRVKAEKVQ